MSKNNKVVVGFNTKSKTDAYNKDKEKLIIDKINELYMMTRYRHLLMLENGTYVTIDTKERPTDKNGRKTQPLHDGKLKTHLRGGLPVGIFAGEQSTKVITFDVDQPTREDAKRITYATINALYELGIKYEDIHISDSGNKGYHIDLLLNGYISNQSAYHFYKIVINKGELSNLEGGAVEFRPNSIKQGVKLPLGIHQKTKKRCWYVNLSKGLEPIEDVEHILSIRQMDRQTILDILDEDKLLWEDEEELRKSRFKFKNKINKNIKEEDIKNTYKPLKIYDQNIIESYTIDYIIDILKNGIKHKGSRHNCLFMLAKYFKCECGMGKQETKDSLVDWMKQQDKRMYSTSWELCILDIEYLTDYVHDNDIKMTVEGLKQELVIYKSEMDKIMTIEEKIGKLILFSMIGHSKRYSNTKEEFYMTYNQIQEATGVGSHATVKKYIDMLHELKYIEIVSRNKFVRDSNNKVVKNENGTFNKYPNTYKITLNVDIKEDEESFNIRFKESTFVNLYYQTVCNLYTNKQLKLICQDRQYREFTKYRKGKLVV